jgi:hypothetical protein
MNMVSIESLGRHIRDEFAIGMSGYRNACILAKKFRKCGKAKVIPHNGAWAIYGIMSDSIIATVRPL